MIPSTYIVDLLLIYHKLSLSLTKSNYYYFIRRIIVCYYTIPSGKNSSKELLPSSIDLNLCSHLIIGFSSVQNCSINLGDNEEIYKQFANLKQSKPDVKFMISVGGMNELEEGYPRMVFNHTNRKM